MSRTIHGLSHKAIAAFRPNPAALAVYWIYVSRMNNEGVAWPSGASLAKTTAWNKEACLNGRGFLVAHEALERVEGYIRPEWRKLDTKTLKRRLTLDRSEYYRPTGFIMLTEKEKPVKYWLLYNGGDEVSELESTHDDGRRGRPSSAPSVGDADGRPNPPELDSSLHLDSSSELDSKDSSSQSEISDAILDPNAKLWEIALVQVQAQIDRATYETWIKGIAYLREDAGIWVFRAPSAYARDVLQHRLYREIRRIIRDVRGEQVELRFDCEGA